MPTIGTRIGQDHEVGRLLEVLSGTVAQACQTRAVDDDRLLDSMGLSYYADALRLLEQYGLVHIEHSVGRRVIAHWVADP